ncbi:MAG: hypothetical protein KKA19_08130 [Candidatus Margulisbacteria bacterium]|nr:hypothetical protein [Candidatus Margulisiibacteriota bacterium]
MREKRLQAKRGVTLVELILALTIAIFIFELVFFVYISLFRSWDIGFWRGKAEDEARRAVVTISKELRSASTNIIIYPNAAVIAYQNQGQKFLYLYHPDNDYGNFIGGTFVTDNYSLKILAANNFDLNGYGGGIIIAKNLLPPKGTGEGTRFSKEITGLVSFNIAVKLKDSAIILNSAVWPRSI